MTYTRKQYAHKAKRSRQSILWAEYMATGTVQALRRYLREVQRWM